MCRWNWILVALLAVACHAAEGEQDGTRVHVHIPCGPVSAIVLPDGFSPSQEATAPCLVFASAADGRHLDVEASRDPLFDAFVQLGPPDSPNLRQIATQNVTWTVSVDKDVEMPGFTAKTQYRGYSVVVIGKGPWTLRRNSPPRRSRVVTRCPAPEPINIRLNPCPTSNFRAEQNSPVPFSPPIANAVHTERNHDSLTHLDTVSGTVEAAEDNAKRIGRERTHRPPAVQR